MLVATLLAFPLLHEMKTLSEVVKIDLYYDKSLPRMLTAGNMGKRISDMFVFANTN